jgi:hypothetical protein
MPLWVSVILAIASMIYFPNFWEAVILFLLSDTLYGVKEAKFSGMLFVSFVTAAIFIVVIEIIKKKTRLR